MFFEKFDITEFALFVIGTDTLAITFDRVFANASNALCAIRYRKICAWNAALNMQENAALSENLISFAGGGNENLFVNKVQAYLLLYSAQYFLKGKPSLSYSHRFSFRL